MIDYESSWAWRLSQSELELPLPRRWAHSQGVARAATDLAPRLSCDAALLVAAAILHDIGYAPRLAMTGFHPLDGARFLRDAQEADPRLARLVANHSFALLEADERGLREQLEAEFPILDNALLVDALIYCDMTTTPDGMPTTVVERIAEITTRYGPDAVVGRFIQRAKPGIAAAAARIEAVVTAHPR